jgi:hypothetical protein
LGKAAINVDWMSASDPQHRVLPLWLKVAYTLFLCVMIPLYWREYGPTNFLYFCDIAALITLVALWRESALLASIAAVGILVPQLVWVLDFLAHFAGLKITGMSNYMFDTKIPLFTRGISLFHAWLPFLLLFLTCRLGYDRRALSRWIVLGSALVVICFFWMPPPGTKLPNPKQPVNINYVYGFSDDAPQSWMPAWAWFLVILIGQPVLFAAPAHLALRRFCPERRLQGLA